MDGGNEPAGSGPVAITEGEWAGWLQWSTDPFELHAGPFYTRRDETGAFRTAFRAEQRHLNGHGAMHGGCLMTFADYTLFSIAGDALPDARGVTASLNSEFIDAAVVGDLVEGTGEVVRAGRSMIFVRGLISTRGRPLLTFSGIIKKIGPRTAS